MIHYMPFTYMSDGLIRQVASAVGSFSVCQLTEPLQPANMRQWIEKGVVDPLFAKGLNTGQLQKAIDEFNHWGSIHEGRLAAMAGLFASDQGRPPLTDEHAPSRISYLIRQHDHQYADAAVDTMFRAALFLAMAQNHDEQQEIVSGTLAGVQRMEMEMASQLAGTIELPEGSSKASSERTEADRDRGLVLIDQRMMAWATLALRAEDSAHLYLTTSQAVFAALMDRLPDALQILKCHIPLNRLDRESAEASQKSQFDFAIEAMAAASDPQSEAMDLGATDQAGQGTAKMAIAVLAGRKPHEVLSELSGEAEPDQPPVDDIINTLFGYLEIPD